MISLMFLAVLSLGAVCAIPVYDDLPTTNRSDKDLYVVHAVVYEVGILTNATNETDTDPTKSDQVAVTFYRKNGSDIDFSKIPEPLFTNVTGKELTGVTEQGHHKNVLPLLKGILNKRQVSYDDRGSSEDNEYDENDDRQPTSTEMPESECNEEFLIGENGGIDENSENKIDFNNETDVDEPQADVDDKGENNENNKPQVDSNDNNIEPQTYTNDEPDADENSYFYDNLYKRQSKREADNNNEWSIKTEVITTSPETLVKSLAIPPLLSLNTNFSDIPVPIPNTSIVSYSSLSSHTKKVNDSIMY